MTSVSKVVSPASDMTVAVWCSWVNSASGGFERVASTIANGLARRGSRVLLVGPYSNAPVLQQRIDSSVNFIEHQTSPTIPSLLRSARELKRICEQYKVNVISAHGSVFPFLPLSVPVVWTEHAIRYPERRMLDGPKGLLWRQVRSRLVSGKWQLVAVSNFVMESVREQLKLDSAVGEVINNAVPDGEDFTSLPGPSMSAPFKLGFLGRLEHDKRPFDIFELDRCLQRLGVPCEWHVFGDGSLRSAMRARAEAECNGRMTIHGYVREVSVAFAAMDMLYLPSHLEGLPTVCLEARLAGRFVAGWKVAGIPEAAGPNGVLVPPPYDLARLAEAISATLRAGRIPPRLTSAEVEFDQMLSRYENILTHASTSGSGRWKPAAVSASANR